jgi:hypothetical protein
MQIAKQGCVELTAGLLPTAERELAAFARAVEEQYGSEQAGLSMEDWIEELESMDWQSTQLTPDWRRVSIAAAARLADRISVQIHDQAIQYSELVY